MPGPTAESQTAQALPDLSLIVPCFNEEDVIGYTLPRLCKAFERAGYKLELIACDNGSHDQTGAIIARLAAAGHPIVPFRVEVNEGYGNGILKSLPRCRAEYVGVIPCDGQVDAEDVVRLYESVSTASGSVVGKVHRRFRLDGPDRAVVSFFFNVLMGVLWPRLGTFDVNGNPKILRRADFERLGLVSKDFLIDAELLVKSHYIGLRVLEMNVFARMRDRGVSHVRASTPLVFLVGLIGLRFGRTLRAWRRRLNREIAARRQEALS
jgi:glycosyltransferase involved in cell wall biosynthesis